MKDIATTSLAPDIIEKLVVKGDLSGLNQSEKVNYYNMICNRVGVDPAMQPFKLLKLQGKEVLYLDRSGAQQLNQLHSVSHSITSREHIPDAGVYQVTSRATLPNGRHTESIGAVNIQGLKGEQYANAIMKAETKAKRRATLDLLGLGMLDETEVETIPDAKPIDLKITDPAPDAPEFTADSEQYRRVTTDVDLILHLINNATDPGDLRTFLTLNTRFFASNPEMKEMLIAKGKELKQLQTA